MRPRLDLQLVVTQGASRLCSPEVGLFTGALPRGTVLVPGQIVGTLIQLGRAFDLRVPPDASGAVVNDPPARVQAPIGYGDLVYELAPMATGPASATQNASRASSELVLRSPQSGRFYHRAAPGEAAFVSAGTVLVEGMPIGLIEVMKTFSHVAWRASGGLPARARVVRMLAADGADVRAGDPLVEVEADA